MALESLEIREGAASISLEYPDDISDELSSRRSNNGRTDDIDRVIVGVGFEDGSSERCGTGARSMSFCGASQGVAGTYFGV